MITGNVKTKSNQASVEKQVMFATAQALTQTAQMAQTAVIRSIESTFTVRNNWDKPSNKFGIKLIPATKDKLQSGVATDADWLTLHETGGTKTPTGNAIAIPTENVRRTKRDIIQKSQRPGALRGKRDIVLMTRNGPVLFQRRGRKGNTKLVPLYRLEPRAKIKKESTLVEPTEKIVQTKLGDNFYKALQNALATAR
ncbi:MAG TPA: hypothetical protein VGC91_08025 [Pyrinomonadaceae bacterium]|jgi:hypothetical protein